MFTGIIESLGTVQSIEKQGSNHTFYIASPISKEFKIDQSIAHNGVCLTIENATEHLHQVTAIEETIKKTNISTWQPGTLVNLERSMQMNGRIDGHIVQGHVDTIATCIEKKDLTGSYEYCFQIPQEFAALIIDKGSISLNGISLTIFNVTPNSFCVAIIPYTFTHTNIQQVEVGGTVNIEFDMIGKYVNRILALGKV